MKLGVLKILVVVVPLSVLVFFLHSMDLTPEKLRVFLLDSGPLGPVVFLVAFWVLQSLSVSAHLFIVAAALVWPVEVALVLSWIGTLGSGTASFLFARYVARDWVRERLPDRIRAYDERLETSGLRTVIVLRLLFFTSPPLQLGLGVSSVGFWSFLAGTAIGNIPVILVMTLASDLVAELLREHVWALGLAVAVLIVAGAAIWLIVSRRQTGARLDG